MTGLATPVVTVGLTLAGDATPIATAVATPVVSPSRPLATLTATRVSVSPVLLTITAPQNVTRGPHAADGPPNNRPVHHPQHPTPLACLPAAQAPHRRATVTDTHSTTLDVMTAGLSATLGGTGGVPRNGVATKAGLSPPRVCPLNSSALLRVTLSLPVLARSNSGCNSNWFSSSCDHGCDSGCDLPYIHPGLPVG